MKRMNKQSLSGVKRVKELLKDDDIANSKAIRDIILGSRKEAVFSPNNFNGNDIAVRLGGGGAARREEVLLV